MAKPNVTIRSGGQERNFKVYTRGQAIKFFCRDCMNGVASEVRNCTATDCPLYAFRPYQKNSLPTPSTPQES